MINPAQIEISAARIEINPAQMEINPAQTEQMIETRGIIMYCYAIMSSPLL